MNNFPYIDILILAVVAVFIINRLKNTLGKKTGNEHDLAEKYSGKHFKESKPDKISRSRDKKQIDTSERFFHNNPVLNDQLKNINKIDNSFSTENFLDGAQKAFEYIIKEYSEENIISLKNLLGKNIYEMFEKQIKNRSQKKENLDINIIGIKEVEVIGVELKKNLAKIKVKFLSEQVQVTKDEKEKIIDGDPNQILMITENWTFSKDLKNKNPSWLLEKIEETN